MEVLYAQAIESASLIDLAKNLSNLTHSVYQRLIDVFA